MADQQPSDDGMDRRTLLRTGGAALAAVTATPAGCVGTLPMMGQRVRYGRVDAPDRGEPDYREWIPAPGELTGVDGSADPGIGQLLYHEPDSGAVDAVGYEHEVVPAVQLSYLEYFGVGYENYDWVLTTNGGAVSVLRGDVDPGAVADALDGVYVRDGGYAGYDLYTRSDRERHATVAAAGDAVVFDAGTPTTDPGSNGGSDSPAHRENVKAVIDAEHGAVDRHYEVDEVFERVTDAAGSPPGLQFGAPHPITGDGHVDTDPQAGSVSYTFDEDAGYFVLDVVFPAGNVPSTSAVRSVLDEYDRALASAATDVTADGRLVTVELRLPESSLDQYVTEGRSRPPNVTWDPRYDVDARTITVVHHAGESFDADEVVVRYGGSNGDVAGAQFTDGDATVGPGDSLAVELPDDRDQVALVYGVDDGDGSHGVAASFELPEA